MANSNGWGDGASNNNIGWGKGADNAIGWGAIHADSWAGLTDIVGAPAFDADAQAFITAAAITDLTQRSAINQLVVDLKAYSIWTKMKAVYPFVGGTSSTHKFNLKNPLDTNAAFRLVFNGGWTHSNNGALPNGTNGWADTFLTVGANLSLNSTHVSIYSRTNSALDAVSIANMFGAANEEVSLWLRFTDGNSYLRVNTSTSSSLASSNSSGFFVGNRNSSTVQSFNRNGTRTDFNASSVATSSTANFNISSAVSNQLVRLWYDNREYAFASIGDGLTNTDLTNFNTAVQAFQTALGRQV